MGWEAGDPLAARWDSLPRGEGHGTQLARVASTSRSRESTLGSRPIPPRGQIYRFRGFELDPVARELTSPAGPITLQPRPFQVLVYLVQHRDRVVPRSELIREVWGIRVGEQALRYAIHSVRRALGDDGNRQNCIRTVRGVGFQFVATLVRAPAGLTESRLRARPADAPFLGREALIELAVTGLELAQSGRGGMLWLTGEAGIGKTRAIEYLATAALRAGFQVVGGCSALGEGEPTFSPWRQIISSLARGRSVSELAEWLEVPTADLTWIAAPYDDEILPEDLDPWRNKDTRSRLFDIVVRWIALEASRRPLFLSLDDVHRADPASLALLRQLAPALSDQSVWIVVSHRTTNREDLIELPSAIQASSTPPIQTSHALRGLSTNDIRLLMEAHSKARVNPAIAEAWRQRTNGNPFFATMLLSVLKSQGRLSEIDTIHPDALALPTLVHDAVLLQLSDLPASTLTSLEIASTAGKSVRVSDLALAQAVSHEETLRRLDPALRIGILEGNSASGEIAFVHSLVQEAVLASLESQEREALHARLAKAIESQLPGREWLRAPELAHHYLAAARITGVAPAIHYLEIAAEAASQRMGFEDAVEFLEQAVVLLHGCTAVSMAQSCRVKLNLGKGLIRIGRRGKAREIFVEVAALSRRSGLHALQAEAALSYAPDFLSLETGIVDMEQVALIESSREFAGEIPQSVVSQLLARLAIELYWSDEAVEKCSALVAESLSLAKDGDPRAKSYSRIAESLTSFSIESPQQLVSIDLSEWPRADPILMLMSRLLKLTGFWLLGKIGRVRREMLEFSALAKQVREPRALWYVQLWDSTLALMEGRYTDARRLGQTFLAQGRKVSDQNAIQSYVLQDFMAALDCGGFERYEGALKGMVERFPRVVGWRAGWLMYLIESGHASAASDLLEVLLEEEALDKRKRNEWYALVGAMAMAASRLSDSSAAMRLYKLLLPHANQLALIGYGSYCFGSAEHLLGLCAIGAGDADTAKAHFLRALRKNRAVGARPSLARVHADLARLFAATGDSKRRTHHIRKAEEISSSLGMYRLETSMRSKNLGM